MPEDKGTLEEWLDDIKITDEAQWIWNSDIEDLERRLEYSSNQEGIKAQIEELKERAEECTAKLEEYAQKIFGRAAEAEEMEKILKDKLQEIYQEEIIDELTKYGKDYLPVKLSYASKTTEILDEYEKSRKRFLIFRRLCHCSYSFPSRWINVDLIVTRNVKCPYIDKNCPTLTEIKRLPTTYIQFEDSYIPDRLEPLVNEIIKIADKRKNNKLPWTTVFWKPFQIGGQTSCDHYMPNGLFGETASYYAIGIILKEG